jgi:hypothetical protein
VLLLCIFNVDSRRLSQEHRIRQLWQKITDQIKKNTFHKFHIDIRHFDREEMVLFPDVAFQSLDNDATWKIMIHGWRYEGNKGKDWFGFSLSRWVERIAKHLLDADDILYLNGSLNRDRLKPFFVEDESDELISVKLGEKTHSLRTDQNGQLYEQIQATNDEIQKLKQQQQQTDDIITYEAIGDNRDTAKGIIRLIEPRQGISIISDVDDTIKISEVLDKVRLIANTFIHPFKPVPGEYEN